MPLTSGIFIYGISRSGISISMVCEAFYCS